MHINRLPKQWLEHLLASADQPPLSNRVPFYVGPAKVGSVESDVLEQIVQIGVQSRKIDLRQEINNEGVSWRLLGEPTEALAALAKALRDFGLAGVWRDEQLAVTDDQGKPVGSIERAAVRSLGITTHAVHLVGKSPDGRIWVQQRAHNKANDPGLWDTLVGGMVSLFDTMETALKRETWEETGLEIDELVAMTHGGRVTVSRPCSDGGDVGYSHEHVDWFTAIVPSGLNPTSQDGEVAQFALISQYELAHWLEQDLFTIEAAMVLITALGLDKY